MGSRLLSLRFVCRSQGWRREDIRTGQTEKLGYDAVTTKASAQLILGKLWSKDDPDKKMGL